MKTTPFEKVGQAGLTAGQLTGDYSKHSRPLVIGGPVHCKDCIALVFGGVVQKVGYFFQRILWRACRYVRP